MHLQKVEIPKQLLSSFNYNNPIKCNKRIQVYVYNKHKTPTVNRNESLQLLLTIERFPDAPTGSHIKGFQRIIIIIAI